MSEAFFIDKMVAETGEVLRGNRFKMTLYFPAILGLPEASKKAEFNVVSTEMPSAQIGTIEIPIFGGHKVKVAGNKVIPEWSCNMLLDGDMKTYRAISMWLEYIDSIETGLRSPDASMFGHAKIQLLNGAMQSAQTWQLKYIFPTDGGSISLSKEDTDAPLSHDISWVINDIITDMTQV